MPSWMQVGARVSVQRYPGFANSHASADDRTPWNTDPATTILYVGIDGSRRDRRRAPAIAKGWTPCRVEFPLLNDPDLSKTDLLDEACVLGLRPPRAYDLGFGHANFL